MSPYLQLALSIALMLAPYKINLDNPFFSAVFYTAICAVSMQVLPSVVQSVRGGDFVLTELSRTHAYILLAIFFISWIVCYALQKSNSEASNNISKYIHEEAGKNIHFNVSGDRNSFENIGNETTINNYKSVQRHMTPELEKMLHQSFTFNGIKSFSTMVTIGDAESINFANSIKDKLVSLGYEFKGMSQSGMPLTRPAMVTSFSSDPNYNPEEHFRQWREVIPNPVAQQVVWKIAITKNDDWVVKNDNSSIGYNQKAWNIACDSFDDLCDWFDGKWDFNK